MDSFSQEFLSFTMNTSNSNHPSSPISHDSFPDSFIGSPPSNQYPRRVDCLIGQSSSPVLEGHSPGTNDSFNATLKFISEVLLEEEEQQGVDGKSKASNYSFAHQPYENHHPGEPSRSNNNYISNLDSICQFRATNPQFSVGSPSGLRGKRNEREEEGGRSSKQLAFYGGDDCYAPTEVFDRVLLWDRDNDDENFLSQTLQSITQSEKTAAAAEKEEEPVELMALLTQCAHAVEVNDQAGSIKLLGKIRQQSSPTGDPNQRLAHYLANALEARITGAETEPFVPIVTTGMSSADVLKAYQLHVTTCPFFRMSFCYANSAIRKLATSASNIHIVDFGILYGFQWPGLIQRLSQRPGGPPKLRITGVELPSPGFRPSLHVNETKRRLQTYCERFNVPSEYNMVSKKWESLRYEDLDIRPGELVVVNCMNRLRQVTDERTSPVSSSSPRDDVLRLIRRMNPELFIHGVVSARCGGQGPFRERFAEAVKHFSALFDMMGATVDDGDPHRVMFEKAVYGRYAENVVGCEGPARVERPESYKEWAVRNSRAGFRQVRLDGEIFEAVKKTVATSYHKDFSVERDGEWLVQGWKGQRLYALSCWKPVYDLC